MAWPQFTQASRRSSFAIHDYHDYRWRVRFCAAATFHRIYSRIHEKSITIEATSNSHANAPTMQMADGVPLEGTKQS